MPDTLKERNKRRAGSSERQPGQRVLIACLITMALIGIAMDSYASQWGPWAFSDGVGYLVTARNLVEGKGLGLYRPSGTFIPTVTHPPLLPFLFAAFTIVTGDVLQAARILNSLLISVLVTAAPLLFRRTVGLASLATTLGLLLIIHPAIILMFLSAMSEPLFVVAGTISLLVLCLYLSTPKLRYLAVACALAAAAMLTRYVGLAYVATGALALLVLDQRGSKRSRLLRAAGYLAAAVLPTLVFVSYWTQTPYARTVRRFALPTSLAESVSLFVRRVGQSAWSWKPVPTPAVLNEIARSPAERITLGLILLGLLIAAIALARWILFETTVGATGREPLQNSNPWLLSKMFSLFVAVFLGGMFLAFAFGLPTPDIDPRTLFPILPSLLIIGLGALGALLRGRPRIGYFHWVVAWSMITFAAGYLPASLDIVTGIRRTGLGFTAREWHQSETMEFVNHLDPQAVLVSNAPEAIMLFTGRSAHRLPTATPIDLGPWPSVNDERTSDFNQLMCDDFGFLILFDETLEGVDLGLSRESALALLSCELVAVFESKDGSIYRVDRTGS